MVDCDGSEVVTEVIRSSATLQNGANGIRLSQAAINSQGSGTVELRNDDTRLLDSNFPDCDSNIWQGNLFRTSNHGCVQ